jgi:hypothetical protein
MADTTAATPATAFTTGDPVQDFLINLLKGVIAALPADQQQQLAADAGVFVGKAAEPALKDLYREIFTSTGEFSAPTASFDSQFDELRASNGVRAQ